MSKYSERTEAFREWEAHWRRWALHELHAVTDTTALLNWVDDETLDGVKLPTGRTLREHLQLQHDEAERVLRQTEERMHASRHLTVAELWRKVDPLGRDPGDNYLPPS